MGFLSVIRRWALRDKMPIREIARRTGLSRNTIKKYLRAGVVEPEFQTPARPSKLDAYAEKLSGWLVTEQRKSRKDRRTAKQMHADLVQLGYKGSYERVAVFVRTWKGDRQRAQQSTDLGTFVPLVFQPGEAFQFDWSEDWAHVGSERIKLQVAHIKLSHSRAFLVRAYLLQTHECKCWIEFPQKCWRKFPHPSSSAISRSVDGRLRFSTADRGVWAAVAG